MYFSRQIWYIRLFTKVHLVGTQIPPWYRHNYPAWCFFLNIKIYYEINVLIPLTEIQDKDKVKECKILNYMLKVIKSKLRVISLVIFLDLSKYNLQGVVACVFPQVRTQYVQVQTQSPHLHLCRNSTLRRQGMTLQIYRYHR